MGKLLLLRPKQPMAGQRLPRCQACREPIAGFDWLHSFQRGVRLTEGSSLTVREFLCPACFDQLGTEEREEWIKRQELAEP